MTRTLRRRLENELFADDVADDISDLMRFARDCDLSDAKIDNEARDLARMLLTDAEP